MFSRRVVVLVAAVVAVGSFALMTGCDWLQSSDSGTRLAPFISKLNVSPASVLCGQQFMVKFQYDDPQSDLANARVKFERSSEPPLPPLLREEMVLWPADKSRSTGTIEFPFVFISPCTGKGGLWKITVQAEDDRGHTSNVLTGEIRLNAAG